MDQRIGGESEGDDTPSRRLHPTVFIVLTDAARCSWPGSASTCSPASAAGALRADISFHWEMDDASVYEKALLDADLRGMIAKAYANWDLSTAGQSFRREVTAELIQAIGGKG